MAYAPPLLDAHERPTWIASSWWPHLTAALLVVMELVWLRPWFETLIAGRIPTPHPLTTGALLAAVMVGGYGLSFAFERLNLIEGIKRLLLVVGFGLALVAGERLLLGRPLGEVLSALLTMEPAAVLIVLGVVWAWLRGLTLGRDPIRPLAVWRRFSLGMFLLMAHIFIGTRLAGAWGMRPAGLGQVAEFLFLSLLAMVFARIAQVSLAHGVRRNPFDRRWLGSIALIAGLTVLAAMGLGALLTGQPELLLEQMAEWIRWAGILFLYAISLPWLLLTWLARPLGPILARLLPQITPTPAPTVDPYLGPAAAPLPTPIAPIVPISTAMQVALFWLALMVVFAALLLARRRLGGGARPGTETEATGLPADWRKLWAGLLRQGAQSLTEAVTRWRGASARLAAARIRRIYAHLLRLSADLGRPRPVGATPLEFLPTLGEVFPSHVDGLRLITAMYERVRYGDLPETPSDVAAVEAAWREIQAAGVRQKRARLGELKTAAVDDARKVKM